MKSSLLSDENKKLLTRITIIAIVLGFLGAVNISAFFLYAGIKNGDVAPLPREFVIETYLPSVFAFVFFCWIVSVLYLVFLSIHLIPKDSPNPHRDLMRRGVLLNYIVLSVVAYGSVVVGTLFVWSDVYNWSLPKPTATSLILVYGTCVLILALREFLRMSKLTTEELFPQKLSQLGE